MVGLENGRAVTTSPFITRKTTYGHALLNGFLKKNIALTLESDGYRENTFSFLG